MKAENYSKREEKCKTKREKLRIFMVFMYKYHKFQQDWQMEGTDVIQRLLIQKVKS